MRSLLPDTYPATGATREKEQFHVRQFVNDSRNYAKCKSAFVGILHDGIHEKLETEIAVYVLLRKSDCLALTSPM